MESRQRRGWILDGIPPAPLPAGPVPPSGGAAGLDEDESPGFSGLYSGSPVGELHFKAGKWGSNLTKGDKY